MDDRTQIAAMIIQNWLPSPINSRVVRYHDADVSLWCATAIRYADALLAELERTKPKCEHKHLAEYSGMVTYCKDCGGTIE